jgi:hypothetical protein
MTTPSSQHRPADPAAAARDGVEAPVRPVLGPRPGARSQAGVIAVAVVAITIVAAGVGLGGRVPEPAASGSTATPTADASALATATRTPRPSRRPSPTPTALAGFGCYAADPSSPPEPKLASSADDMDPAPGVIGPPDSALSSPPTASWPIPLPEEGLDLHRSATIVLVTDARFCIGHVVAEYLAVDALGAEPTPLGLGEIDADPPQARLVLGGPPQGDWIVRILASFVTGLTGEEDDVVVERFFRVVNGATPEATPLITPAVPCGGRVSGSPPPRLSLVAGDREPMEGVDLATYPGDILHNGAIVRGVFPEPVRILIEDDVCATSWTIEFLEPITGNTWYQTDGENPRESLDYAAQNRIMLDQTPLGASVLRATVRFGRDEVAKAAWELRIDGPTLPAAEFSADTDGRVAAAIGCGSGWSFRDGASAFELCETQGAPDSLGLLVVGPDDVVTMDVPGWDITSWSVACGSYEDNCSLGAYGDGSVPVGPARFLPPSGRKVIFVWIGAMRGDLTFYGQYYAEVDTGG